jgi:hypothetical protein
MSEGTVEEEVVAAASSSSVSLSSSLVDELSDESVGT